MTKLAIQLPNPFSTCAHIMSSSQTNLYTASQQSSAVEWKAIRGNAGYDDGGALCYRLQLSEVQLTLDDRTY
jgi:hypothetical protein